MLLARERKLSLHLGLFRAAATKKIRPAEHVY